jgi:hypothetical protein
MIDLELKEQENIAMREMMGKYREQDDFKATKKKVRVRVRVTGKRWEKGLG